VDAEGGASVAGDPGGQAVAGYGLLTAGRWLRVAGYGLLTAGCW